MKVLITGATGQLGRSIKGIVPEESKNQYIFAGHDDLDITDEEAVQKYISQSNIDIIINCAAYTAVDQAESDIEAARSLNAAAPSYLAKSAYGNKARLIHISTDYVFSGEASLPYGTDDETCPRTIYGITKAEGEKAISQSGCEYMIIRTAWLYSPYGKNFVKTIMGLIGRLPQIKVVSDQIGSPTNAIDLAGFIIYIVENDKFHEGIYHFTNDGICSWYEFAREIALYTGNASCEVNPCTTAEYPTAAQRPAWSVLDKKSTEETFGIEMKDWKISLKGFIEENGRQ